MPSWKISVLSHAAEPGSRPPTSPWCAVVVAKPISASSRKTGLKTKMSCRWMPPSNGSFITKTSPGSHAVAPLREQRAPSRRGTEPRWNGTVTACATVSPSASQSAAEKSMPSRTTVECAVRKIVVAISSAIDASALPTISCVIGSTRAACSCAAPGSASRSRRRGAPSSRAGRRPSCRTRRPASAPAPARADRGARADRQLDRSPPKYARRACRAGPAAVVERRAGRPRSTGRAPRAAARGSRSASRPRRGRRTAARARPRTPRSAPRRSGGPPAARPRPPTSARRSAARRCAATRPHAVDRRREPRLELGEHARRARPARPCARRGGTRARRGTPAARTAARAS